MTKEEIEELAKKLRQGSQWSNLNIRWEEMPPERKRPWIDFAKHAVQVITGKPA